MAFCPPAVHRWFGSCVLLAFVLSPLVGCGGGPALPPRGKVKGTVTLDGKPLKKGQGHVVFVPDAKGPPAVGVTDDEGNYSLSTDRESEGDGAMVGFHRVRISEVPNPEKPDAPLTIPTKYGDESTANLKVEVKPGDNDIPLKLKSQ